MAYLMCLGVTMLVGCCALTVCGLMRVFGLGWVLRLPFVDACGLLAGTVLWMFASCWLFRVF